MVLIVGINCKYSNDKTPLDDTYETYQPSVQINSKNLCKRGYTAIQADMDCKSNEKAFLNKSRFTNITKTWSIRQSTFSRHVLSDSLLFQDMVYLIFYFFMRLRDATTSHEKLWNTLTFRDMASLILSGIVPNNSTLQPNSITTITLILQKDLI